MLPLLVALAALSFPAAAPNAARRAEAKAHFEAARAHHKVGRFERAIEEYERAYELIPLPDLLFNLGQCHRNLKQYERAIFFFERYLQEAPADTDASLVQSLIKELREANQAAAEAAAAAAAAATATITVAPPPAPVLEAEAPSAEPQLYERWWFWTLIAVGVAGVAGGTIAATRAGDPEGSIGTIDAR